MIRALLVPAIMRADGPLELVAAGLGGAALRTEPSDPVVEARPATEPA